MKTPRIKLLCLALALAALAPQPAAACAVCMGGPEDPVTQSIGLGILFLLAVIGSVLAGIAGFFVYIVRRSALLAASEAGGELSAATGKV